MTIDPSCRMKWRHDISGRWVSGEFELLKNIVGHWWVRQRGLDVAVAQSLTDAKRLAEDYMRNKLTGTSPKQANDNRLEIP